MAVLSNDHPPPHVHVIGPDRSAKFELNCPAGPVRLVEQRGFRHSELNDVIRKIAGHLNACCALWEEYHGGL